MVQKNWRLDNSAVDVPYAHSMDSAAGSSAASQTVLAHAPHSGVTVLHVAVIHVHFGEEHRVLC